MKKKIKISFWLKKFNFISKIIQTRLCSCPGWRFIQNLGLHYLLLGWRFGGATLLQHNAIILDDPYVLKAP